MKQVLIKWRRFVAILIGIVFLGSGLLKIEDPVGTMLIVREYLKLFHLAWLLPCAKGIGIVLATSEALIGVGLITGVFRKLFAWLTLAFLAFFTLVTLVLWILNPSMDCGCFGEAIHLTHAQSFWKNVVLLVLGALAWDCSPCSLPWPTARRTSPSRTSRSSTWGRNSLPLWTMTLRRTTIT